ncbi:plastocyanin/azurin family copper-binding protein [Paraconexibacter antarcticus]|uniref:Plastocyanin/azurin family copper-binding protein n=1 Tax=Paraconexibacter antarcticus TaxID=2949664 RepID=A0ABY5DYI1_9ACTN|nr:plastocyanin/azurin family copper-binding protein [Paraconexibacter antarcticus]UTI65697.1 plastocyanin/azurin family copper-binding protein [Paraconexibacter antarcticus]
MNRPLSLLLPVAATGLLVAGCGSSSKKDDTPAKKPAAEAGTKAVSTNPAAAPVDASSGKVTITTTEYKFSAPEIHAKAGKLKVTLDNKGGVVHEFVVLKDSAAPGSLKPAANGRVSEKTSVGEVSETDPGKTRTATLDLKPGKYIYVCNIPTHYMSGMYGELVVK